jgi:hypothetical protein
MYCTAKDIVASICYEVHGLPLLETNREIGARIGERCTASGTLKVRVKLQIDAARGHSTAQGHGNFQKTGTIMLSDSILSSNDNPHAQHLCCQFGKYFDSRSTR